MSRPPVMFDTVAPEQARNSEVEGSVVENVVIFSPNALATSMG